MQKLHHKAVWIFFFRFLGAHYGARLPVGFVPPIIVFLGIIFSIYLEARIILFIAGTFLLIFLLTIYTLAVLAYHRYRYQLTGQALKIERGIIRKHYIAIPYSKIQSAEIYQGVVERTFRLSSLLIETAGEFLAKEREEIPGLEKEEAERIKERLLKRI